jgi:competence protein ComEC
MIRKYPGIFLLVFVIGGIFIADLTHWPSWLLLLAALSAGLAGLFVRSRTPFLATVLLAAALGGVAAVHFALSSYDFGDRHLARAIDEDRTCQIFGRVSDWPDLKANLTEITLAVDSLGGDLNRPVEGGILLKVTDTSTALQIGDRVEFHGRIYPLRQEDRRGSGFDYGRFLRMKGISGIVYLPTLLDVRIDRRYDYGFYALSDRLRAWITDCFNRNLPPNQAALASGFLIGETRDIPTHVYQQFRQSGTLHLLAVSGSNVALVLLVVLFVMRPFGFGRRARGAILLAVLLLFTVISYGQPSVIRAAVMAGLVIVAGMLERRYDLNNIIALSAVIILLFDPGELFDVGFQLSYATAWGLIFIVPRLTSLFQDNLNTRWYRWIAFPLIISLVAQIVSTPLVLLYFGQAPVLSVPANLLIVPLTGIAVVGAMVLFLADLIWPILALLVGSLVSVILGALLKLVALFGSATLPAIRIPAPEQGATEVAVVMMIYLLIVSGTLGISNQKARRLTVWIALCGCLMALIFAALPDKEGGEELRLTTVPGGVAGVRTHPGSRAGDLILIGAEAREYSVSDRILCPWLARLGIMTIDKCFILGSDYRCLEDIFALTDSLDVSVFYLPASLKQSASDVLTHSGRAGLADRLQFFGKGAIPLADHDGYYARGERLQLATQVGTIMFAGDYTDAVTYAGEEDAPQILVIGESGGKLPSADSLKIIGIRQVICSRFEQKAVAESGQPTESAILPGRAFRVDLRTTGEFVLSLDDRPAPHR